MNETKKPFVLISNDDGVYASGLQALIEIIRPFAEILVVAPLEGQSGMSHAITVKSPLHIKSIKKETDLEVFAVNGTPVDCVKIAINQIITKKPDVILSGINHGTNSSVSVFYSGTMGAAMEGCLNGIPSAGFSLDDYSQEADFSQLNSYVLDIFNILLQKKLPENVCLNVNFPAKRKIEGLKITRQAQGRWVEKFIEWKHPHSGKYFWLAGDFVNFEPNATDTDEWAIKNGFVSVLPLKVDITDYKAIDILKNSFSQ